MGKSSKACVSLSALLATLFIGGMSPALAQSAYRCEDGGKVTYSDKPCPLGRAVAPTQDTPEQRAAAVAASEQLRKDQADLNKRLSEREKLEAQERAAARKAAASGKDNKSKKSNAKKAQSAKQKAAAKKAAKPRGKGKAADNRSYSKSK